MSTKAAQIAELVDMLPDEDKDLAYELVKKLVLAWDPDFTKLTPSERQALEAAEIDTERISHNDINWD